MSDGEDGEEILVGGRGLHWFIFQLNASAFCGIGGASRGYLGGVYEVLGGVKPSLRVVSDAEGPHVIGPRGGSESCD